VHPHNMAEDLEWIRVAVVDEEQFDDMEAGETSLTNPFGWRPGPGGPALRYRRNHLDS
jgi:hypothetical protein